MSMSKTATRVLVMLKMMSRTIDVDTIKAFVINAITIARTFKKDLAIALRNNLAILAECAGRNALRQSPSPVAHTPELSIVGLVVDAHHFAAHGAGYRSLATMVPGRRIGGSAVDGLDCLG